MAYIAKTVVPRSWQLTHHEKPWTVNAERSWHFHKRARAVKEVRNAFAWLAVESKVPALAAVRVSVVPLAKDRRGIQDVAACMPAAKAAIDGLVDAGVIPDDNPSHMRSLAFYPTQVTGTAGLRLVVTEVT